MAKQGRLIAFDGPDGAGKTTQLKAAENFLKDLGYKVLVTKEPGSPHIPGNIELRKIALTNEEIGPFERELVFMADASIHAIYLKKWLNQYDFILCDRGIYSHIVYQNATLKEGKISTAAYKVVSKLIPDCVIKPDHTIIFDVEFATALLRMKNRGTADVIEKMGESFLRHVNEEYKAIKPGRKLTKIDANGTEDEVAYQLKLQLNRIVRNKSRSRV